MGNKQNNFAFVDGINLHLTFEYLDWKLDYRKLRIYLGKRQNVITAYYFLGFIKRNKGLYKALEADGYELKFREVSEFSAEPIICPHCKRVVKLGGVKTKCDCDSDITLQMIDDIEKYDKAILITSDGDFDNVVKKLIQINKLKLVLAPCKEGCSRLLKNVARGRIEFLDNFRGKLEKI